MTRIDIMTLVVGMVGFALFVTGVGLLSMPAALLLAGILLMAWSFVVSRLTAQTAKD
jgi:uncharacterized membrane protein YhhN